jgi:hypothetical protein
MWDTERLDRIMLPNVVPPGKLAGIVPLLIRRRAAAVSLMIPEIVAAVVLGAFPGVLIGLMAADHAARSSAEQAVMAGIMPCHPADGSTL